MTLPHRERNSVVTLSEHSMFGLEFPSTSHLEENWTGLSGVMKMQDSLERGPKTNAARVNLGISADTSHPHSSLLCKRSCGSQPHSWCHFTFQRPPPLCSPAPQDSWRVLPAQTSTESTQVLSQLQKFSSEPLKPQTLGSGVRRPGRMELRFQVIVKKTGTPFRGHIKQDLSNLLTLRPTRLSVKHDNACSFHITYILLLPNYTKAFLSFTSGLIWW